MTAIEHRELRGITIKNLVVTIMGTASIVASVMTTYFGLKSDIQAISNAQKTEERINNMRIKILEDEVFVLQKQVDEIKSGKSFQPGSKQPPKSTYPSLLTSTSRPTAR
jgi:hypothetical protein